MLILSMASTITASFWRGGTSNGLLILASDLPDDTDAWPSILCPAMGSPDPYSRQLNGMGGGISSLSKICVVSASSRSDADVEYRFIQVGVEDTVLDMAGNCGNMSAAVGPFALDEGLVPASRLVGTLREEQGQTFATIRLFNINTSKVTHSRLVVSCVSKGGDDVSIKYEPRGSYGIDGVSGTASPIALSFLSPAGSKTGTLLPSGNIVDHLSLSDGTVVPASLVDAANPAVFIRAADVGVELPCPGEVLDRDKELMVKLEDIRRRGAMRMGLDPNVRSIPKVLLLSAPRGEEDADTDIRTLALSMGRCHKAVPLTLGLNLGVSCSIEGTLPHSLRRRRQVGLSNMVRIGHASGTVDIQADIESGSGEVKSATLMRTARLLMRGEVNCQ